MSVDESVRCARCGQRSAVRFEDTEPVCESCAPTALSTTAELLRDSPVARETTIFASTATGAFALATGYLGLAVVASLVVVLAFTVPRYAHETADTEADR